MLIYEDKLLAQLEKDLEYYDKVFLAPDKSKTQGEFLLQFCNSKALENCGKKVLIMSVENAVEGKKYSYRKISWEEATQLKKLYCLYEFSDRFQILSKEAAFGDIYNFVDTGILTVEEVCKALLH